MQHSMRILIAEDDPRTLMPYKIALKAKGHNVITTDNGEDCIEIYQEEFEATNKELLQHQQQEKQSPITSTEMYAKFDRLKLLSPFDAVVLDYRMPKKDGMEVAKEILNINPNQRIIFASAYVKDTLLDAVKELKQAVELMQKPFKVQALVDTTEVTEPIKNYDIVAVTLKK